jgi:activator of HSP90 ATPase
MDSIECSIHLVVSPEQLFQAWLDSAAHTAFTGSPAEIDPAVGGAFTAWDGYISGVTLELDPPGRIVQSWHAADFPEGAPASRLEVRIEPTDSGSRLTLLHTGIPAGMGNSYREGWQDSYFTPMMGYFSGEAWKGK